MAKRAKKAHWMLSKEKKSANASPYDFYCPVCKTDKYVMCKEKGYEGETIPHASRVQLAEHNNAQAARELAEQLKRNAAYGFRTKPTPRSVEEIVGRLLDVFERGDWPVPEVNTLAVWNRRTDLFCPGDPALLSYTNGGGTRCGMIAWSSKKRAVIGPKYVQFSTSYYRDKWIDFPKNFDIVAHLFNCEGGESLIAKEMVEMRQFKEPEKGLGGRQALSPVFRAAAIQRFERHGRTYTAGR